MLKEFGIKDDKIFKVAVVSTMSSGKSTFINALLGKEFLLSRNEACSAQVISILDNDTTEKERAFLLYDDGTKEKYDYVDKQLLEKINVSSNVDKVLIETELGGIKNTDRAMVIIDTPGVNNSMDKSHKQKTMGLMSQLDEGLIIYLINATQIGIDDDYELLKEVSKNIKNSNGQKKIIFVVNKMDELDEERENVDECMNNIHKYLTDSGIVNPQIYPVSSLACKLFRMAMSETEFTRREARDLINMYERFQSKSFNMSRYTISDEFIDKDKSIKLLPNIKYSDLYLAIENTGIPAVEHAIEDIMAEFGQVYNPVVTFEDAETVIENPLNEFTTDIGFEIKNNLIVRCPEGVVPQTVRIKNGETIARFKRARCVRCVNKFQCGIILKQKSAVKVIKIQDEQN